MFTKRQLFLAGLSVTFVFAVLVAVAADLFAAKPGGGTKPTTAIAYRHFNKGSLSSETRGVPLTGGTSTLIARGRTDLVRWSPDGSRLLYVEGPNRGEVIVSVAPDGSDRRELLTFAEVDAFNVAVGRPSLFDHPEAYRWTGIWSASWSSDGSCITFEARTCYDWEGNVVPLMRIFAADLATREIWQVTDSPAPDYANHWWPDWSHGIDVIGYARTDDSAADGIWAAATNGSWARPVLTDADGLNVPYYHAWSHSGDPTTGRTSLAVGSNGDVYVVDIDLSQPDPVTGLQILPLPGAGDADYPAWAPDDSGIVFSRFTATQSQIVTFLFATGQEKVLVSEDSRRVTVLRPDWR